MIRPKEQERRSARTDAALFVALLIIGIVMIRLITGATPPLSHEAIVRTGVGRDLLDGLTRGRQGLVGSLYWPPLPTLVALPLLHMVEPIGDRWACVTVSVASGALLCAFLCAWFRRCGLGRTLRLTATVAIFLSPALQRPMMSGSSEPLFVLLTVAALCFLLHWLETDQLRSLAYLSITLALALLTRYQGALLIVIAALCIGGCAWRRQHSRSRTEATFIIFLAAVLYVAGLWVASNWLIMGESVFFLRGLPTWANGFTEWFAILSEGCEWELVGIVFAIALVGWVLGALMGRRRTIWTAVPILAACLLLWTGHYRSFTQPRSAADAELPHVLSTLRTQYKNDWIIMAGYRGYEAGRLNPNIHHTLSFYRDVVMERTQGKRTYLLVPEPKGRDRWEDINLKYPGIFETGAAITVHERSWNHWRLQRVVRLDETDRR